MQALQRQEEQGYLNNCGAKREPGVDKPWITKAAYGLQFRRGNYQIHAGHCAIQDGATSPEEGRPR